LLVAQVLRNAGCPVRVIGKHPEKLRCARSGRSARGRCGHRRGTIRMSSSIAPAVGAASSWRCRWSARAGTIVLKSTVAAGKPLNCAPLVIDEIQVVGSRCGPFREAIRALPEKQVDCPSSDLSRDEDEAGGERWTCGSGRCS
jgi:hypothetical protein